MDWILFWTEHRRQPELTQREQLILCAAVRHAGYCIDALRFHRKIRLRRDL